MFLRHKPRHEREAGNERADAREECRRKMVGIGYQPEERLQRGEHEGDGGEPDRPRMADDPLPVIVQFQCEYS